MKYCFAPMEGITGSTYRRLHRKYFKGVDKYYTPFISPTGNHQFTGRNLRELAAGSPEQTYTVPQLLTASADDFLWAAQNLSDLGFTEANLNLGCPSGTVVSKGKGAGFLADTDGLTRFFDTVFRSVSLPVSVKTRLGVSKPEEFYAILEIYNRYPIKELILHPRTRTEFYKGDIHTDFLEYTLASAKMPVICNGNLFSAEDCRRITEMYPNAAGIMVGRALLARPQLFELVSGEALSREKLTGFHNELCECYLAEPGGKPAALPRMKELWFYLSHGFDLSEKDIKRLNKTTHWDDFFQITRQILSETEMRKDILPF